VYSILFEDPEGGGFGRGPGRGRGPGLGRPDGQQVLEQISRETGARSFQVSKKMPLERVFSEIEEDLRNQYNLGYTSNHSEGRDYRHIHVTTRQKGLAVQTREGYYPT